MTTRIDLNETQATITLDGRLDTPSAHAVETEVKKVMIPEIQSVVVECTSLSYISSSGLRILITLYKYVTKVGGQLTLKAVSPAIREIFDMTGFTSIFTIVD